MCLFLPRTNFYQSFHPIASNCFSPCLARIMHEPPAATADLAVLPGVLGSRTLRRTNKYASGPSPCGCPVARPSPRSRYGVSYIMRARPSHHRRNGLSSAPSLPYTALGCPEKQRPAAGRTQTPLSSPHGVDHRPLLQRRRSRDEPIYNLFSSMLQEPCTTRRAGDP